MYQALCWRGSTPVIRKDMIPALMQLLSQWGTQTDRQTNEYISADCAGYLKGGQHGAGGGNNRAANQVPWRAMRSFMGGAGPWSIWVSSACESLWRHPDLRSSPTSHWLRDLIPLSSAFCFSPPDSPPSALSILSSLNSSLQLYWLDFFTTKTSHSPLYSLLIFVSWRCV